MNPAKLEILAYETTPLGALCLRRRELLSQRGTFVTEVTLNHEFLMSSYFTASERALARRALEMRAGGNSRVLIGGLGLGYTACEALQCGEVTRVDVIEFLPQIIGWLEQDLVPLAGQLTADRRLSVTEGDIYAMLRQAPLQQYEVILVDVDHSPEEPLGDQSRGFYSVAGLHLARKHLAGGGVLGVWSSTEDPPFADAMRDVFADVHTEKVTVWNNLVDVWQTDWLFFAKNFA